MKRSLAILLRKLANRLDPPKPTRLYDDGVTAASAGTKSYRLTFLP